MLRAFIGKSICVCKQIIVRTERMRIRTKRGIKFDIESDEEEPVVQMCGIGVAIYLVVHI